MNYLDGDVSTFTCKSCNEACKTCSGPNNDNCITCKSNYFLIDNKCILDCGLHFCKLFIINIFFLSLLNKYMDFYLYLIFYFILFL